MDKVRIDCYTWNKIQKVKNIRDYDTIILNLLTVKNLMQNERIDWDFFRSMLNFSSSYEILANDGQIFVIGDPRFEIPVSGRKKLPFLFWTGFKFNWDSQPGDTINLFWCEEQFKNYASKLTKWDYSLADVELDYDTISEQFNLAKIKNDDKFVMGVDKHNFVVNRYQHAIAFILSIQVTEKNFNKDNLIVNHGPMIFLPETSMDEDETIITVLQDICNVPMKLPEPNWVNQHMAPGQGLIDEEINNIIAELELVNKKLQIAIRKKRGIRRCLKLLYEREYALKPVVHEILEKLGARVEKPSEKNKEDGWITVETPHGTCEGVLEIKTTKFDHFDENSRKQLLDWVDWGRVKRLKNYKGIFIGSNAVNIPVDNRPAAFSKNWAKAAELSGICAMRTEDLYYVYVLNSKNKLDVNLFWELLFKTNGIFDITAILKKAANNGNRTNNFL